MTYVISDDKTVPRMEERDHEGTVTNNIGKEDLLCRILIPGPNK